MQPYEDHGPVHPNTDFPTDHVQGKTAIVTGGANGIGEAYVRHLVRAGAFVVFGDVDEESGRHIESELGTDKAQFVVCDVTQWKPQLEMFKHALTNSTKHRVDIVIANAGISGSDDVFHNNPGLEEPEEPMLNIVKVNGLGVLYTTKLALHYFRRQRQLDPQASQDQLLILQGSLAGYVDLKGALQYGFCKWGMRGLMRNLRRTEHEHNTRVNYIAPTYVRSERSRFDSKLTNWLDY
jgi:NAD(P)-dependent dehydrogenase (short-subunit alcohol dehydrogenase family)